MAAVVAVVVVAAKAVTSTLGRIVMVTSLSWTPVCSPAPVCLCSSSLWLKNITVLEDHGTLVLEYSPAFKLPRYSSKRGHSWTYAEAWTRCTARHLTGTGASTGQHACTIAEEIHAPDRAAQGTAGEGGNIAQDLGLEVDEDDPTDSQSPLCSHTGVRVLEVLMR